MLIVMHGWSRRDRPATTVTLRSGDRVLVRRMQPDEAAVLASAFERLPEESRFRRFFTVRSCVRRPPAS
jgi:hypothetical protein